MTIDRRSSVGCPDSPRTSERLADFERHSHLAANRVLWHQSLVGDGQTPFEVRAAFAHSPLSSFVLSLHTGFELPGYGWGLRFGAGFRRW